MEDIVLDEYIVERSSVEARWTFNRMLPSLPGPGTPAFAKLVKSLHPYGINPLGVSVEAPTSSLGDVVLGIALLEKRVALRITAASFELLVHELLEGDDANLVNIADLVLDAIREVDSEIDEINVKYRISSHLSLPSSGIDEFLQQHQVPNASRLGLVTDAVAYNVRKLDKFHSAEVRFVITKSIAYNNALFLEANSTYLQVPSVAILASWIASDFEAIMVLLGLSEGNASK